MIFFQVHHQTVIILEMAQAEATPLRSFIIQFHQLVVLVQTEVNIFNSDPCSWKCKLTIVIYSSLYIVYTLVILYLLCLNDLWLNVPYILSSYCAIVCWIWRNKMRMLDHIHQATVMRESGIRDNYKFLVLSRDFFNKQPVEKSLM